MYFIFTKHVHQYTGKYLWPYGLMNLCICSAGFVTAIKIMLKMHCIKWWPLLKSVNEIGPHFYYCIRTREEGIVKEHWPEGLPRETIF